MTFGGIYINIQQNINPSKGVLRMNRVFIYILIVIGIANIIAQFGFIIASLFGFMHYYPIFQLLGTSLLVLFAIDHLKFNHSKSVYLILGLALITSGVLIKL